MEKLRIRCPQCTKLYEVQFEDIPSTQSRFRCVECSADFFLSPGGQGYFKPGEAQQAEPSPAVEKRSLSPRESRQVWIGSQERICPKCGALSKNSATECYSCGVIFERLEAVADSIELGAQPSLVRRWKHLMENFSDEEQHRLFIELCGQLGALRYALKQYSILASATGEDPQVLKYVGMVKGELELQAFKKNRDIKPELTLRERFLEGIESFWAFCHSHYILLAYAFSILLIIIGFFSAGQRNLVGIGVALALLVSGIKSLSNNIH